PMRSLRSSRKLLLPSPLPHPSCVAENVFLHDREVKARTISLATDGCEAHAVSNGILKLRVTGPGGGESILCMPGAMRVGGLRSNLVSEDALVRLGITVVRNVEGTFLVKNGY